MRCRCSSCVFEERERDEDIKEQGDRDGKRCKNNFFVGEDDGWESLRVGGRRIWELE